MKEPINICIIDDHQFIIDGVKRMLKSEPSFEVVLEFTNPLRALHFFQYENKSVDLIICDISMPEMSGIKLMKAIKSINPLHKILALTMHESLEFAKQLYQLEVEGYLFKNSEQKKFIKAMKNVISGMRVYENEILRQVIEEVKSTDDRIDLSVLTEREIEILKLIIEEKSSKAIAETLKISKQTVDTHRKHIIRKTKVNGIIGLIKFAYTNHLIH